MAVFGYGNLSIGTSSSIVIVSDNARKAAIIYNNGSAVVYLGMDSTVTTTNGLPILPQASLETANRYGGWRGDIYAISGSPSQDIRYWYWQ